MTDREKKTERRGYNDRLFSFPTDSINLCLSLCAISSVCSIYQQSRKPALRVIITYTNKTPLGA